MDTSMGINCNPSGLDFGMPHHGPELLAATIDTKDVDPYKTTSPFLMAEGLHVKGVTCCCGVRSSDGR